MPRPSSKLTMKLIGKNDTMTVMSTMQLVPGDVVLLKSDAFQGKRKAKNRWSDSEYVTDDVPTYEVKDDGRNVKVIHCNRLFFVATVSGGVTPLGASESLSEENIIRSTLAEFTPLVWKNEAPESNLDEAATLCLASCILLVWVDGSSMATAFCGPKTKRERVRS